MFKKTLLAATTLFMVGCASTNNNKVSTEIVPYDESRSLAFNVAQQVEMHFKLKDTELPSDANVRDIGVLGHAFNTFFLSPNFLGSFSLSLMADDKHGADRSQLIFTIKPEATGEYRFGHAIANKMMDIIKQRSPDAILYDIDIDDTTIRFKEKSKDCSDSRFFDETAIWGEDPNDLPAEFTCYVKYDYAIHGLANPVLFPNNKGEHTVKMRQSGGAKYTNFFVNYIPDGYLYHPADEFRSSKNKGEFVYGQPTPPFVEHKNKAYFFVKTEEFKKAAFELKDIPQHNFILLHRVSKHSK